MKALSHFVSFTLVILFVITSVSLVLVVVTPALDKAKDSSTITEAFRNLETIDTAIKEVASEGENAKRTINIKITEGTIKSDPTNDYLNFTYTLKEDTSLSGQRNNINITKSGKELTLFIAYSNIDINGTAHFTKGDNKIIIENQGVSNNKPVIYIG
ncbi:MAG: hypothetical protein J7J93_03270 [Candidatus Aenigmarchaeota archaeon]|nr:hypothetical protein [Candidatus Aenigmarchaeota archaeon]